MATSIQKAFQNITIKRTSTEPHRFPRNTSHAIRPNAWKYLRTPPYTPIAPNKNLARRCTRTLDGSILEAFFVDVAINHEPWDNTGVAKGEANHQTSILLSSKATTTCEGLGLGRIARRSGSAHRQRKASTLTTASSSLPVGADQPQPG